LSQLNSINQSNLDLNFQQQLSGVFNNIFKEFKVVNNKLEVVNNKLEVVNNKLEVAENENKKLKEDLNKKFQIIGNRLKKVEKLLVFFNQIIYFWFIRILNERFVHVMLDKNQFEKTFNNISYYGVREKLKIVFDIIKICKEKEYQFKKDSIIRIIEFKFLNQNNFYKGATLSLDKLVGLFKEHKIKNYSNHFHDFEIIGDLLSSFNDFKDLDLLLEKMMDF